MLSRRFIGNLMRRSSAARRRSNAGARLSACVLSASMLAGMASGYDWPQLNGDSRHSGNNTQETILSASSVAGLQFLFQATLPSIADGAPAVLTAVNTPTGVRDLLFVTTQAGHIIALDATSGAQVWSHQYPAGSCRINLGTSVCYTTSSPAIDPGRQFVYSYGLDGFVHKYQVGDGTEIMTGGWPELATLKGFNEKGSSALSIATATNGSSYLYVTNGGYPGDAGDYQGHVTAINLADGTQRVFNSLCSDQAVHFLQTPGPPDCLGFVQSAIWARVGVVYDDVTNRIYMATGNGIYDGNVGGHEWADSVFSLNPDGTGSVGKPLDSFTPASFQALNATDADLGSTAPAILPAPGYAGRLAVQGGKDALLRLINLANLSGFGGPGHTGGELQILPVPQGGLVLSAPAVWVNPADSTTWVFVADPSGISGLRLTVNAGIPSLSSPWQTPLGGFSPLVANNVLYYAGNGFIRALDPTTGGLLWSDTTRVGSIHWESPVVANGVLYITDQSSHLTAYSLGPAAASITPRFGPTAGGTSVTILGAGFQPGAGVTFGGAAATGVSVPNATTVLATTPAHAAGLVDVVVTNPDLATVTLPGAFSYSAASFFTVMPCRIADTRKPAGPYGGPAVAANSDRDFVIAGQCGIPALAKAVSINVTVTQPTTAGDLRLYPGSGPLPLTSAVNYRPGQTRANNTVSSLGAAGDLVVRCDQAAGTVHLIIDVNGYFQ